MTPSILLTMFGNKVLIELKRKLQEIYTNKPWAPIKENSTIFYNEPIYNKQDDSGKWTYHASKKINAGDIICPLYVDNSVTDLGLHINHNQNPNCQLVGNDLVAFTEIIQDTELTIPGDVYDDIHH